MFLKHQWYIKLTSWEYWPSWILYIPVWIQHFYLAFKAKSLFFFLKVNPAIVDGFILSDSKFKTLQLVPPPYLPKTIFVDKNDTFHQIFKNLNEAFINFPIILKPDIGYRGLLVHKINNAKELELVVRNIKVDYILQEYVDFQLEIGIFYFRLPNNNSGSIPSITIKEFLSVTGDGIKTLEELVNEKPRAILQREKIKYNFKELWGKVIPHEEKIILEFIGNHNRGTKFINGNYLYDEKLLKVFDELNRSMPGFYFGRFDIRAKSIEDLKNGKNFKILEVNGVGAEPTHVYDPDYKLLHAWKDILCLWRIMYVIAMQNKQSGEKFPVYSEARKRWRLFKSYKKIAFEG